jgi:hypothetical protein
VLGPNFVPEKILELRDKTLNDQLLTLAGYCHSMAASCLSRNLKRIRLAVGAGSVNGRRRNWRVALVFLEPR